MPSPTPRRWWNPAQARWAGVVVGVAVVVVTALSQSGALGGHDFSLIALVGLIGVAICLRLGLQTPWRREAAVGAVLSLVPVLLLVGYLAQAE